MDERRENTGWTPLQRFVLLGTNVRTTLISVKGKAFSGLLISSQALSLNDSVTSQHCHTQTKLLKDEPLGENGSSTSTPLGAQCLVS